MIKNKESTQKAKMFQNEILKKLPSAFTDRSNQNDKKNNNFSLQKKNKIDSKSNLRISNKNIQKFFEIQHFKTNEEKQKESHMESSRNKNLGIEMNNTSCDKIKDIQMVEMDRKKSTFLDLDFDLNIMKQPNLTKNELEKDEIKDIYLKNIPFNTNSISHKMKSNSNSKNDIASGQNYLYQKNDHFIQVNKYTTKVTFKEKGIQKNTLMTNEFTNKTGTSKEISSRKTFSQSKSKQNVNSKKSKISAFEENKKDPVNSSLSLKQLTQTFKKNDKILDSSSKKESKTSPYMTENKSIKFSKESKAESSVINWFRFQR
jgi:hypothetical protein